MQVERITPETALGRGWARARFQGCSALSELASFAIVRPRHVEPYLGLMGWQISENRFPLNIEVIGESDFSLLLAPNIVQFLEVASNYEFCFFNRDAQRVNSVIVRWSGVSYRPPRADTSPIEIYQTQNAPISQSGLVSGRSDNVIGNPLESKKFESNSTNMGFGPAWTETTGKENYQPSSDDVFNQSENFLVSSTTSLPPEPVGSYDRKLVRRIRCRNPNCGAEILDSMKKCPFCNSSY